MSDPAPMAAAPQVLFADRYHAGMRFASLLWWLGAVSLVYFVGSWVLGIIFGTENFGWLIWLVVSLVASQPLARLGEKLLLQWWPSGRALQLTPYALIFRDKGSEAHFDFAQKVNYLRWRFDIRGRRGGRVPNGHHCLVIRLVQDERSAIFYAFLSTAKVEALNPRGSFYELRRPNETGKQPLGGREATFVSAEHERWEQGAELEPADFETLIAYLSAHVPDFAASPAS